MPEPTGPPRPRRKVALFGCALALSVVAATGWITRPFVFPPAGETLTLSRSALETGLEAHDGRVSILLVGDTHFGENYFARSNANVLAERGYSYPAERLRPLATSADLVIANLETPLTARHTSPLGWFKDFLHWGEPEPTVAMLRELRIRAVSLANNHTHDQWTAGLNDTLHALARGGVVAFGSGRNVFEAAEPYRLELRFARHTLRVAVLGACASTWNELLSLVYATTSAPGGYALTESSLVSQIRALKRSDPELVVVVFPHWGDNYKGRSAEQSRLAHAAIDAGADLVAGHGAHLLQEVEPYADRMILYGLGNFLFLSEGRYSKATHSFSLAARLNFSEEESRVRLNLRLYFIQSNNRLTAFRPEIVAGDDFARATRLIAEGGTLTAEARSHLQAMKGTGHDEFGPYLEFDLGRVGG